MIKNQDIIITGLQPWDIKIGSNCKDIATELSKNNRVLYVDRSLDFNSFIKGERRKIANKDRITQVSNSLYVLRPRKILLSVNWLPFLFLFQFFNRINNWLLASEINWAAKKLSFKNTILFCDNDFFRGFYLKDFIKPTLFIYYIRDYLNSQSYFKKFGQTLEPQLISKADLVVTNSLYLKEYAAKCNLKAYFIGQGCDFSSFENINKGLPADLQPIKRPIIGYTGALISLRLDIDLLVYIAETKPEWSIVLVGPEDEQFKKSNLHQLPNVHFLGSKPSNVIPEYIYQFDVCINPQILNEMTIGNYPRKIDEYLILGKPTVVLETKAMEYFKEYVYLSKTNADFVKSIEQGLINQENEEDKRVEFASQHTWENCITLLSEAINNAKA